MARRPSKIAEEFSEKVVETTSDVSTIYTDDESGLQRSVWVSTLVDGPVEKPWLAIKDPRVSFKQYNGICKI